ncbi:vesicular acetylcholine transporter unc-17-like [Patiria miniata]|uniref:Major facilitator superfamily (MFS) profile domain-containing protein n=1 Tax=Patiria miniata TaxID=46514 RepID=A0A914BF15_PATMI|nr:vesicular acetylcholine transporter unc-17-like [Patiria miniata]
MANFVVGTEKWLRILTSIGAMYLECSLWGAVQPLVSEWDWAMNNVTREPTESQTSDGNEIETRTSFTVAAIFFAMGLVEIILSPITGMVADRCGFDVMILLSLLCGVSQSLLFGCFDASVVTVLIYRILGGASSALSQTIGIARIRDVYTSESRECSTAIAVGMSKMAAGYFAALITGELYHFMKHRVFLLFLPVCLILIIGVLLTFRNGNFHSKTELKGEDEGKQHLSSKLRWRVVFDVQLIILCICFFVTGLGVTALDPSLAVWMKSVYGAGAAPVGFILGVCGLVTLIANITSGQVLHILKDWSWIFCMTSLCITGLPLVLINFSPDIVSAGVALCGFFSGLSAVRFTLILLCTTIANSRYPQACGHVFGIVNIGWAAPFLVGPLLAPYMFGSTCAVCIIGAACIASAPLAIFLRQPDSNQGLNLMDCCADDHGEYKVLTKNDGVPFAYDISEETLQPKVK